MLNNLFQFDDYAAFKPCVQSEAKPVAFAQWDEEGRISVDIRAGDLSLLQKMCLVMELRGALNAWSEQVEQEFNEGMARLRQEQPKAAPRRMRKLPTRSD